VRGADLNDLFRTAAEGVFDYIVVNRAEVRAEEHESVSLDADSTEELLAAWLNELIFRCETKHRLFSRFDVRVADDGRGLQAEIAGEPIDRDRHILDHEVKAVTHHGLTLQRAGSGWLAELILDI
jgi:SHS2 domain-containing protein